MPSSFEEGDDNDDDDNNNDDDDSDGDDGDVKYLVHSVRPAGQFLCRQGN